MAPWWQPTLAKVAGTPQKSRVYLSLAKRPWRHARTGLACSGFLCVTHSALPGKSPTLLPAWCYRNALMTTKLALHGPPLNLAGLPATQDSLTSRPTSLLDPSLL